jgi:CRP-like cAMP-binding protein
MIGNDARLVTPFGEPASDALSILGFPQGAVVFHQGDRADHWYVVRAGVLRTCRFRADGQRQLTGFFFAGDVIGFESGRYRATAEAVTETRLECYNACRVPVPAARLERALANAGRYILLLGHRTATERLAAFLIGLPRDGNRVALPMSRSDIADYLGLTIHTISRTFSDFSRRSVLISDGRHGMRIADLEQLALLSGEAATEHPVHEGSLSCPTL